MQFVDPVSREGIERSQPHKIAKEEATSILFALACKMVAFDEAKKESLGNALIKDALEAAKCLPEISEDPVAA